MHPEKPEQHGRDGIGIADLGSFAFPTYNQPMFNCFREAVTKVLADRGITAMGKMLFVTSPIDYYDYGSEGVPIGEKIRYTRRRSPPHQ